MEADQELIARAAQKVGANSSKDRDDITVTIKPMSEDSQVSIGMGLQLVLDRQIWWRKPDSWREDAAYPSGGTVTTTGYDGRSLQHISWLNVAYALSIPAGERNSLLLDRLNQIPLLSVFAGLGDWTSEMDGTELICGYEGQRIRALWTKSTQPPAIWPFVAEFEAVVLPERGVLLRYAGFIEGQKVGVVTAKSIDFDEEIRDEVFQFEPAPDTSIIRNH